MPESGTDEVVYGDVRIFPVRERGRPGEGPKGKVKMDSGFRRNDEQRRRSIPSESGHFQHPLGERSPFVGFFNSSPRRRWRDALGSSIIALPKGGGFTEIFHPPGERRWLREPGREKRA